MTTSSASTEGKEPKGLIRDPEQNVCVELPIKHRELFTRSMTLEESRSLACTLSLSIERAATISIRSVSPMRSSGSIRSPWE